MLKYKGNEPETKRVTFWHCSAVNDVYVPDTVTVLEKITKGAEALLLTSNGPILPVTLLVVYVYPGSNAIIIVSLI